MSRKNFKISLFYPNIKVIFRKFVAYHTVEIAISKKSYIGMNKIVLLQDFIETLYFRWI